MSTIYDGSWTIRSAEGFIIIIIISLAFIIVPDLFIKTLNFINNNDSNEILIKRDPQVHTRSRRAVQKNKRYHLG